VVRDPIAEYKRCGRRTSTSADRQLDGRAIEWGGAQGTVMTGGKGGDGSQEAAMPAA